MVNKILFWSGFGLAVRFWQMGIEMRPFFSAPWAYPVYATVGASFGYWLQGVNDNQLRYLRDTRDRLLEKRARRAEREGGLNAGTAYQKGEGIMASPREVTERAQRTPTGTVDQSHAAQ